MNTIIKTTFPATIYTLFTLVFVFLTEYRLKQFSQNSQNVSSTLIFHFNSFTWLIIHLGLTDVALDREVEGDLIVGDMGQGMPFRPGTFDGCIRWTTTTCFCWKNDVWFREQLLMLLLFVLLKYFCAAVALQRRQEDTQSSETTLHLLQHAVLDPGEDFSLAGSTWGKHPPNWRLRSLPASPRLCFSVKRRPCSFPTLSRELTTGEVTLLTVAGTSACPPPVLYFTFTRFSLKIELITTQAMRAGFSGGMVVDYPNSSKAKKLVPTSMLFRFHVSVCGRLFLMACGASGCLLATQG